MSRLGIHHDPPCPLPALIAGSTVWAPLPTGGWERRATGGRLFLADGLWDLEYGPRDLVLLDGNLLHGVTTLRSLPGHTAPGVSQPQLQRRSVIMFNRWKVEKMKDDGNYSAQWRHDWMDAVPWLEGCEPVCAPTGREHTRGKRKWDPNFEWGGR